MKKNELVCVEICYETLLDEEVSRQTMFISKKQFKEKKKIPVRIRKNKIKSISLRLVKNDE